MPGSPMNEFFSIHQDEDKLVQIYWCRPNIVDGLSVYCGNPVAKIDKGHVDSKIIAESFGSWGGEEEVLAITQEHLPGVIEFFYMSERDNHKVGDFWMMDEWAMDGVGMKSTVMDIELQDSTLYAVVEGSENRFVMISHYDGKKINHEYLIGQDDYEEWPTFEQTDQWMPEEVRTNPNHKNVLFVLTAFEVIVLSIENHQPRFVHYIHHEKTTLHRNNHILVTANSLIYA